MLAKCSHCGDRLHSAPFLPNDKVACSCGKCTLLDTGDSTEAIGPVDCEDFGAFNRLEHLEWERKQKGKSFIVETVEKTTTRLHIQALDINDAKNLATEIVSGICGSSIARGVQLINASNIIVTDIKNI